MRLEKIEAMVAEMVLGYAVRPDPDFDGQWEYKSSLGWASVKRYARDFDATIEILEEFVFWRLSSDNEGCTCFIGVFDDAKQMAWFSASATARYSAALAVCLAALKAEGLEVSADD